MQEQMMGAIAGAMKIGTESAPGSAAVPANAPGRRFLAAMFKARENGCECVPCRLLREEVEMVLGAFLKEAAAGLDEIPPAAEPAAVTGPVETPASV